MGQRHSDNETKNETAELPASVAELRALVLRQKQQLEQQSLFIEQLLEQIRLARHQHFGARSERFSVDQLALAFNEAEALAAVSVDQDADQPDILGTAAVPAHLRAKGGRRPLPKAFPRIEIVHTIAEGDCRCGECQSELIPISEKVTEQLDIQPARVQVLRHVRKTYACKACDGKPVTARMPNQPIPRSLASPGTLAHVAVAKYVDGLPLYRQEKKLARIGVHLPRSTLAHWMVKAGKLVQPLINLLRERLLAYDIVAMDETRLQALKEPGKRAESQSYLWVQRGGPPDHPILLYDYDPSRSQKVPIRLLEGFSGYLLTDGYEAYGKVSLCRVRPGSGWLLGARPAQVRRGDQGAGPARAGEAQGLAGWYRDGNDPATLPDRAGGQGLARRRTAAGPAGTGTTVARGHPPLARQPSADRAAALGKAMNYAHKQWLKLIVYVEDGRLQIDNNLTENAIRPFVIGRKNSILRHRHRRQCECQPLQPHRDGEGEQHRAVCLSRACSEILRH